MENKSEQWHGLHAETATIEWKDLERFFAKGHLLSVGAKLDLVDAAVELANDNKSAVEEWLKDGQLTAVSSEQALRWSKGEGELWSVVVLPWILVQERT